MTWWRIQNLSYNHGTISQIKWNDEDNGTLKDHFAFHNIWIRLPNKNLVACLIQLNHVHPEILTITCPCDTSADCLLSGDERAAAEKERQASDGGGWRGHGGSDRGPQETQKEKENIGSTLLGYVIRITQSLYFSSTHKRFIKMSCVKLFQE